MIKTKTYTSLFILFSFLCLAQKTPNKKITVRKHPCCDSLSVRLGVIRHSDTISYNQLSNLHGLGVSFKNCIYFATATIISFEVSINNSKPQFVKGNIYAFDKHLELKSGGEVVITNCIVDCKNESKESKTVTLPERRLIVTRQE